MATPRELEVIRADITIAKNILYPQDGRILPITKSRFFLSALTF